MQQVRLTQPGRRAQIDFDGTRRSFGFKASCFLCLREVAGERYLRGRFGHRPECVANDEFGAHHIEATHHRSSGIEHFGQPRARPVAHRCERVGESSATNQVVG